ncbi:MAG: type IV pilus assembly protein PilM [Patescibacteria group bacterium]|jgi:type IV pilus assembly protein PilM
MFKKTQSYLGVDIGKTSVKIVELRQVKGKSTLINYGYSEESRDFSNEELQLDVDKAAEVIKKICNKSDINNINCIAAMPSFSVFSSILNLSHANKKELDNAVMLEAKKVVPLDLDEMILDWKIIEESPVSAAGQKSVQEETPVENNGNSRKNKEELKVLLTGAPKSLVKKYIYIFKEAKMNLISLETEMFSLIRSLVGSDPSIIAIVDLGAVNTDIAIIENGLPMFSRSLDSGGIMMTKAISDSLKVDFRRAEQFKIDLSSSNQQETAKLFPKVIEETITPIVNEIKYSLNLFQQENNKKIEKLIISGGGANLPNITEYLSSILNIKVIAGDPWSRISYPLDLKSVLDDLGPQMAIAVGLAMRETS